MKPSLSCIALVLTACMTPCMQGDDTDCLTAEQRANASLYASLQQQAYEALDRRLVKYEQLKTSEQILEYQQQLRSFFIKQLGGFPERTPLNAKTIREVPAEGYRVECVTFESQPNHHVTANLYLPETISDRVPGIVVSSGHSRTAKTAEYNQRFGIAMAMHGMAALCFDPIGQGERSQILTEEGTPKFSGTTTEHLLVGVGSTLVGRSTAQYRVWDAMRAIDYLAQRPEIDPGRIGMTGCSGGGTLTSYVMALDDRVQCAAPACYLTTFQRLLETIGPQDAEQNVYGQIAFGLDHPDYLLLRAPKPTLISSTTTDFFSIDGSWENFRQAKRAYGKLGFPERVDLVEIEGNHGVQPQNLATIVQWMKRWLQNSDQPVNIMDIPTRPEAELLCTGTGQVLTAFPGERSVFDLNAALASRLQEERSRSNKGLAAGELRAKIREMLGIGPESQWQSPELEDLGRIKRDDYHIDKLVLRRESHVPIPGLTFHPASPHDDAYLYLHDSGKLGDTHEGGPVEQLVREGYAVVTIDLGGQGETAAGGRRDDLLGDWKTYYLSYLLGRPLLGFQVEDALAAADFVAYYERDRNKPRKVHLVGAGRAGLVALHAAALQPEWFASLTLKNPLNDWSSLVAQDTPAGQLDSVVHAALTVYDLPDLLGLVEGLPVKRTE